MSFPDKPPEINPSTQPLPVNPADQDDKSLDKSSTGSIFGRSVSRLRHVLPFLKRAFSSTESSKPKNTPLAERNISLPEDSRKLTVSANTASSHSYRELLDLQRLQYSAAIEVVQDTAERLQSSDKGLQKQLEALADDLGKQLESLEQSVALKDGDQHVSKRDIKAAKKLPKLLQQQLVKAGMSEKMAKAAFHRAHVNGLNHQGWTTFSCTFKGPKESGGQREFTSEQLPACEMRHSPEGGSKSASIFRTGYSEKSGVSCMDKKNTEHATNLWKSGFQINGEKAFSGIRHGVIAVREGKDPGEKASGAEKKAEEVLVAALASKPELFQQALAAGEGTASEAPSLMMTSTSLLTTGIGSSADHRMQVEQNRAFASLLAKANKGVLEFKVPGPDGQLKSAKVKVSLATFNIPVNMGGVGKLELATSGRRFQKRMNDPAMIQLVGGGISVGGEARQHVKRLDQQITRLEAQRKQTRAPGDYEQLSGEIRALKQEKRITRQLGRQIKEIYRSGSHHHEGHDTYKLAARVTYLTHLIGGVPLYNCKSGKDRTGMLDAEVKLLAAQASRDGAVPKPGRLSEQDQELFRAILLKGGGLEIQKANTGVRGYKTERIHSIDERIGEGRTEDREEVRGLSKTVGG